MNSVAFAECTTGKLLILRECQLVHESSQDCESPNLVYKSYKNIASYYPIMDFSQRNRSPIVLSG
jgi:hypothetical protein